MFRYICGNLKAKQLKSLRQTFCSTANNQNINSSVQEEIDPQTIQLLERLSLVDLSSKEALETLQKGIQFANKIQNINTDNIEPLYTVLEHQDLQLRPDVVLEGNCRQQILSNSKVTDEDYFVSPPGNIPLEVENKKF